MLCADFIIANGFVLSSLSWEYDMNYQYILMINHDCLIYSFWFWNWCNLLNTDIFMYNQQFTHSIDEKLWLLKLSLIHNEKLLIKPVIILFITIIIIPCSNHICSYSVVPIVCDMKLEKLGSKISWYFTLIFIKYMIYLFMFVRKAVKNKSSLD